MPIHYKNDKGELGGEKACPPKPWRRRKEMDKANTNNNIQRRIWAGEGFVRV